MLKYLCVQANGCCKSKLLKGNSNWSWNQEELYITETPTILAACTPYAQSVFCLNSLGQGTMCSIHSLLSLSAIAIKPCLLQPSGCFSPLFFYSHNTSVPLISPPTPVGQPYRLYDNKPYVCMQLPILVHKCICAKWSWTCVHCGPEQAWPRHTRDTEMMMTLVLLLLVSSLFC